jgi:hypothetical protein
VRHSRKTYASEFHLIPLEKHFRKKKNPPLDLILGRMKFFKNKHAFQKSKFIL